ncbi:MAG: hypothetical protein EBE86_003600 [Hormoscilla sp. GUM202]|nr:hypothetical protein [Hormoscilla sp. GUM202]
MQDIKEVVAQAAQHLTGQEDFPGAASWYIGSKVVKADIIEFLQDAATRFPQVKVSSKDSKDWLIATLLEHPQLWDSFFQRFNQALALHPPDVEYILQCSRTERKRWESEGKLPVVGSDSVRKHGQDLVFSLFDFRAIARLSPEEIAAWRKTHALLLKRSRKIGAYKAKETKVKHNRARLEFGLTWQELCEQWEIRDAAAAPVLKLAYWCVWVSRWAKEYQIRAHRARKYADQYRAKSREYYQLKHEIVRVLVRSPYAQLSFYRPDRPHKIIWDDLDFDDEYDEPDRFYDRLREPVRQIKDYYSLYYLSVASDRIADVRFSFHTPYPIGKKFLPVPNSLPQVKHSEQEGIFRFGRVLFDKEKITHGEKMTCKQAEFYLDLLQHKYAAIDKLN